MEFLEKYKAIVDELCPSIDKSIDLYSAFVKYEIEGEPNNYFLDVHLSGLIIEALKCNENCEMNQIKKARDHLLFDFYFTENSLKSYLDTLEVIYVCTQLDSLIASFDEEEKWKIAIKAAMDHSLIIEKPNLYETTIDHPRHYNVAKSAKFFQSEGFNVNLIEGKFIVDNSGLIKVCNDIETRIKLIGGKKFIKMLLDSFYENQLFDKKLGRFLLNRKLGLDQDDPLPPFGYLLNLAAKYTYHKVTIDSPKLIDYLFSTALEKAIYLSSIYDLQPYNTDELTYRNLDIFVEFIRGIALFDSTFSIIQLKPSNVLRILKGLFDWIDANKMESSIGVNLNQIIEVVSKILGLSNKFEPVVFTVDDLSSEIDIDSIKKILEMLSIDGKIINQDYHLPTDKTNFIFKPLIKNGEEYLLLSYSWCSPAFYEAIMSGLRDNYPNLESKVGLELEEYIKKELSNAGITFTSGFYKSGRKKFECDLVIESEQTVVFIEIKKKAFTRTAKAGDEISLIIDLSKSLLDATLQSGQHEIFIRENEHIQFVNNTKIDLKGRSIIRVALTLLDFGGFQDNTVIDELFRMMLISDVYVNRDEYEADFKKIQEKMSKLKDQYINLKQCDDGFYERLPFHNCWFLSLPQLLMLIDDSTDNDSFVSNLKSIRGISSGSLDYYYDYTHFNKMFDIKSHY